MPANKLTQFSVSDQTSFIYQPDNTTGPKVQPTRETDSPGYTIGTAIGKVDKIYDFFTTPQTIAPGATLSIDLASLTLLDSLNAVLAMARLKHVRVKHTAASLSSGVKLDGAYANTVAGLPTATLPAGASVRFDHPGNAASNGLAVVAGTGDIVAITNLDGANAATVLIELAGGSA